jgi:Na+/H+ antiporter NhaD/arsenite permease-like protein
VRAVFTAYLVFTIGVLAYFWVIGHSWFRHPFTGWSELNQEQLEHGVAAVSWTGYLGKPDFWEQSFQNWQSVFLAIGAMVVFSVYLRQRGSGEATPVGAPHSVTGESG